MGDAGDNVATRCQYPLSLRDRLTYGLHSATRAIAFQPLQREVERVTEICRDKPVQTGLYLVDNSSSYSKDFRIRRLVDTLPDLEYRRRLIYPRPGVAKCRTSFRVERQVVSRRRDSQKQSPYTCIPNLPIQ